MCAKSFPGMSTTLHAVGTVSTGAAIALVGQIFNIQEHWPAAVLHVGAGRAGWVDAAARPGTADAYAAACSGVDDLRDRVSRQLAHWLNVYLGRFLFVWAILYLTFFLGSRQKIVQGILFAAAAISATVGTVLMLDGWESWSAQQSFIPFSIRVWAWIALAALPLVIAAFHGHKGLIPVALAVVLFGCAAVVLPELD